MSRSVQLASLLLALLLASPARGQVMRSLSDSAQISLITILPGDPVYAAFGHSALRVHDPEQGLDWMYSYGTFDFNDPLFIPKFTYGRLTYWLDVHRSDAALRMYRYQQRPVIEQTLALNRQQKARLFRFLQINALPSNRYYQYDFLFDNCSTRIRDALATALGDSLRFAAAPNPQESFRHLLDPYVVNRPWVDFGFDLALGMPAEQIASPHQAMFLPHYLMEAFDAATLVTERGRHPLVTRTDTLFWVEGRSFAAAPSWPWPTMLFWLLFLVGLADAARRYLQHRGGANVWDAFLFGAAGLAGAGIFFLWFISEHYVTNQNWNLLWAWPTHLAAAWALARGRGGTLLQRYLLVTAGAAFLAATGWAFWPQDLHAAAFPLTLLLAVRSGWRALPHPQELAPA